MGTGVVVVVVLALRWWCGYSRCGVGADTVFMVLE